MKQLFRSMVVWGVLGGLAVAGMQTLDASESTRNESKVELLAFNRVSAEFLGIEHKPCMMRTALCPDRCKHSRDVAVFNIKEYLDYKAYGKYADERQSVFYVNMDPHDAEDPQSPAILNAIRGLKQNQQVILAWTHLYVTDSGCSSPQRRVIELTPQQ